MEKGTCSTCYGAGTRITDSAKLCDCMYRAMFRVCMKHYRYVATEEATTPVCKHGEWTLPNSLFTADFDLVLRLLEPAHRKLFRLYFELGLPYTTCMSRLGLSKGNFFHAVYRVELILGREFHARGMFPLQRYLGTYTAQAAAVVEMAFPQPLKRAA